MEVYLPKLDIEYYMYNRMHVYYCTPTKLIVPHYMSEYMIHDRVHNPLTCRSILIENMHRQYVRSGYVWEQYDDSTGQGKARLFGCDQPSRPSHACMHPR